MVAAAVIGGAVVGAGASAISSSSAAHAQERAAQIASDQQAAAQAQIRADLLPYQTYGTQAGNKLMDQLPSLTTPFNMSQAGLEATPGYQFARTQGLKAVQNSASARGLGVSGAAQKGAASFATGLADQTYGQQFDRYQAQQNNIYNKLLGVTNLGENAAAQTGAYGMQAATNIGQNTIGAGNAAAAANIAGGNAIAGAANSIGNLYLTNALLKSGVGGGSGKGLFG